MPTTHTTSVPAGYAQLAEYLPTVQQRARALGISRALVCACDQGLPIRAGSLPARRVTRALAALEALDRGDKLAAGRAFISPGPTGRRRSDEVRRRDPGYLDELRQHTF